MCPKFYERQEFPPIIANINIGMRFMYITAHVVPKKKQSINHEFLAT